MLLTRPIVLDQQVIGSIYLEASLGGSPDGSLFMRELYSSCLRVPWSRPSPSLPSFVGR